MIVLNMIVRNAADTVLAALESVREIVDFAVIGFAGESEDGTEEKVSDWLTEHFPERNVTGSFEFKDFADARNRVLALTPEPFFQDPNVWMIWLDADDTVLGAAELPGILEQMPPQTGAIQFPYVYQQDENGNPLVVHDRERLIRLSLGGWSWYRPVHETLRTVARHGITRFDNLTWIHNWKANQETRSERNLGLLMQYLEEQPDDRRTVLYIAHSHYSNERWAEALDWFARYYHEPDNELEKWQAAVFAGDCAFQLGDHDMAIGWYMQALDVRPELLDPYLGMAACYVQMGEHEKAMSWYQTADGKQLPPPVLFVLPGRYTFNRWAYEHHALAATNHLPDAIAVCDRALEYTNNRHQGFWYYRNGYQEQLDRIRSVGALQHLSRHLQNRGDAINANEILRFAPKSIVETPEFVELRQQTYRAIEHLYDPDVDIYSGDECWAGSSGGRYETEPELMPRVQAVFDILGKHAAEKAKEDKRLTVVDLGCGDGAVAIRLAEKHGYLVTGIDSNPTNIERAKQRAEERGVAERTRFICADVRSLALDDVGAHDAAIVLEVIEHVSDPAMLVGTAFDLAETVVVTTPHQEVGDELRNTPDGVHLHHVREFDFLMMCQLAGVVGANIETLTTAYTTPQESVLPGYGQWVLELNQAMATQPPVVFYVGPAAEKWTPEQINGAGIGGSETAVVEMARQFRREGHAVFVYGPVDGIWDGVFYRKHEHFVPEGPAAGSGALLFVSSRVPEVFDRKVNAAVKWLWTHDNSFTWGGVSRLTPERAEEIDNILVLSEWHRRSFAEQYPFCVKKLMVTANGIDPGRFAGLEEIEREAHRFVWSSSFDRGLDRVLTMWPQIRERWEDAELHVYYGFELADAMYGTGNAAYNALRARLVEGMQQEGVVYHGRMPQAELPQEFAKAGYWLYPTAFAETYCITALEAQAAGVFPVTSAVGALPERQLKNWPTLTGDDDLYLDRIVEIDEWTDDQKQVMRATLRGAALKSTWERTFKQWRSALNQIVKGKIERREREQRMQASLSEMAGE